MAAGLGVVDFTADSPAVAAVAQVAASTAEEVFAAVEAVTRVVAFTAAVDAAGTVDGFPRE
jgi:hypothetical protein